MNIRIEGVENKLIRDEIFISGSKSESNRLLILQKLFPELTIKNLSDSDDTHHLQHALTTDDEQINIGHAVFNRIFCFAKSQNCGSERF